MAVLEELQSPVAAAIEAHYKAVQSPGDDGALRCSKIGEPCERSLWYGFRWATPLVRHAGRVERLFQTGHREEVRMIADLRAIGVEVSERDPETGEQWRVSFLNGLLKGSADGRSLNIPGAEKTVHLLECKTHSNKSFQDWRRKGVQEAKPVHYAQMQIYMHGLCLTRALYVAHNKDNDEVETERVKYDPLFASRIVAKAERIVFSDIPSPKTESYLCRFCRHDGVCHDGDWARVNCRTCLHVQLSPEGQWRCGRDGQALSEEQQHAGCRSHLYLPGLVPGAQIDANEESQTVTYRLSDGSSYVDGRDPKPAVPAVLA